jgi:predicted nucleic acid-binding protein
VRTVVADASAILDYLLGAAGAEAVRAIVEDPDTDVHVPALCDVEVASGLRHLLLSRRMSVDRATEAVEDYLDLPLVRHGHESLVAPILGRRANFTAYDATYLTLAETMGASLLSTDRRLLRAVARHSDVRSATAGA